MACQLLHTSMTSLNHMRLAGLLLLAVCVGKAACAATVEHSLDGGVSFSAAGQIHLHERGTDDAAAVSGLYERQPFSSTQLQQLQQLVETDSLYLWRVALPDQLPVLTSIKAACLAAALSAPQYALQLDAAGKIMSAQISVPPAATPGGACSTSHALHALKLLSAAGADAASDVEVAVHMPTPGPAVPKPAEAAQPDLMAATDAAQQQAQKQRQQQQQQQRRAGGKEGEAAEGEGGEAAPPPVDDRTWLQKNWLMLMAGGMMIINIVMKGVAGEQGGPGGAPQGRPPAGRRPIQ